MRFRAMFLGLLCLLATGVRAAEKSAREAYDQLNALRVDPARFTKLTRPIGLSCVGATFSSPWNRASSPFLQLFEAVLPASCFLVAGHILAAPRDPVEKQQMAHFLGAPGAGSGLYFRLYALYDDTAPELLRQLRAAGISPPARFRFCYPLGPAPCQVESESSPSRALRIPFRKLPSPIFYGAIDGATTALRRGFRPVARESLALGQTKMNAGRPSTTLNGPSVRSPPDVSAPAVTFHALRYTIGHLILVSNSLEAKTEVRFRAETGGETITVLAALRTC